jgi:hypothetical protein
MPPRDGKSIKDADFKERSSNILSLLKWVRGKLSSRGLGLDGGWPEKVDGERKDCNQVLMYKHWDRAYVGFHEKFRKIFIFVVIG